MYTHFFHLSANPFSIAPDPRFLFASHRHQEGLAHLLYGIQTGGGFVALTGEVGTGKTLLCHCLLQQLPATVDMALILNPRVDAIELLASICDELGIPVVLPLSLKTLVDALNKHLLIAHAAGRRTVLMIDEAQNLSLDVLEQIRLLTNLETTTDKLLQIILVGQPELQALLNRPALRQLNQRITAHYHLQALDAHETAAYIKHRIAVCQGSVQLFKPAALRKIFLLSGGIPRLINRLCDRALLGAYTLGAQQVSVKLVKQAAKEAGLAVDTRPGQVAASWPGKLLWTGLLLSVLFVFFIVAKQRNFFQPAALLQNKVVLQQPVKLEQKPVPSFNRLASMPYTTLNDGLENALRVLAKPLPEPGPITCDTINVSGLACFLDQSSWKGILDLKRPVILELDVSPERKIFVLLTGLSGANAVFNVGKSVLVPLKDIMRHWKGYYLLVWEPPFAGVKEVAPYQTHAVIGWVRQQLDEPASATRKVNFYDKALQKKIISFQQQHDLVMDGYVGVRTMVHLQNQYQHGAFPQLILSE